MPLLLSLEPPLLFSLYFSRESLCMQTIKNEKKKINKSDSENEEIN